MLRLDIGLVHRNFELSHPHIKSPWVQMEPSQAKFPCVWGIPVGHIGSKRLNWIFYTSNFHGARPQSQLKPFSGFTVCGENLGCANSAEPNNLLDVCAILSPNQHQLCCAS